MAEREEISDSVMIDVFVKLKDDSGRTYMDFSDFCKNIDLYRPQSIMQHLPDDQEEAKEMKGELWRNICECTLVSSESFSESLMKKRNRDREGSINTADLEEGETGVKLNDSLQKQGVADRNTQSATNNDDYIPNLEVDSNPFTRNSSVKQNNTPQDSAMPRRSTAGDRRLFFNQFKYIFNQGEYQVIQDITTSILNDMGIFPKYLQKKNQDNSGSRLDTHEVSFQENSDQQYLRMSNDSPIGSPMATKKTVSFDPNSTKKESATKVTIGNSMDFMPNQTTGKNLAAAVHEDAANYGGGSFKVRQSDQQVQGEMYDEKYATMKVSKKGETVSAVQGQIDQLRISANQPQKEGKFDRYIEQPSEDNSVLLTTLNKTKTTNQNLNNTTAINHSNTDNSMMDTTAFEDQLKLRSQPQVVEAVDVSSMGMVATKTFQAPQPARPNVEDDTVMIDAEMSMSIVGAELVPLAINEQSKTEKLKQSTHYMDEPVIATNVSFGEDKKVVPVVKVQQKNPVPQEQRRNEVLQQASEPNKGCCCTVF